MYVCMYIYMYIYTHTYKYIYIYICLYIFTFSRHHTRFCLAVAVRAAYVSHRLDVLQHAIVWLGPYRSSFRLLERGELNQSINNQGLSETMATHGTRAQTSQNPAQCLRDRAAENSRHYFIKY